MITDADIHESLRILAAMRARRDRINRVAAHDHDLVEAWAARQLGDLPDRIALAEAAIAEMAAEYTATRKAKTISTPWGTVATRTTARWAYDEGAATGWAAQYAPELVVTPPPTIHPARLDKQALKASALIDADGTVRLLGETVPGVTVTTVTTAQITTEPTPAYDADEQEEAEA